MVVVLWVGCRVVCVVWCVRCVVWCGVMHATMKAYLANEAICSCKCGVHLGAHTNEATRDGNLQAVLLGKEADDAGVDGHTLCHLARTVLHCLARPHFDLVTHAQHTLQNTAASHTTLGKTQPIEGTGVCEYTCDDTCGVRGGVVRVVWGR